MDWLEISLEIPSEGLETSWMGQKPERTFPVSGDYAIEEAMGTYTQNNGRVSFVTADGKTYVTPFCFEARETLKAAGYKEGSLYVPLSNGEVPVNPEVAEHWKKMCEKARELFNERVTKEKLRRCAAIAESKKIERWNKITKEAAEQSFRNISPNVSNIMTLKELVNLDYDLKLIASTKEKEKSSKLKS